MDGVAAIAEILRREGVDFIGCVPYQPLLEAAAIAGIRPIIFRQEGTGIHMVDLSIALLGRPTSVWARLARLGSDFANGDTLSITIGFASGATAMLGIPWKARLFGKLRVPR